MKSESCSKFRQVVKLCNFICVMPLLLLSCGKSRTSYRDFMMRGSSYYAAVAQACSELLSQTNQIGSGGIISGDNKSLPKMLLDLHATSIEIDKHHIVGTNDLPYVTITFGEGRAGFTLNWVQNDYGHGRCPWELTVAGDFEPKVLFSTTNIQLIQKGIEPSVLTNSGNAVPPRRDTDP